MTQIIWFNRPTNHSGSVNFLFLTPENEIDNLSVYVADPSGPYILGGPMLAHYYGKMTEAGLTLVSLLPTGFQFFNADEAYFRKLIEEVETEMREGSYGTFEETLNDWGVFVHAKNYSTVECCEMLTNNTPPDTPIAFVRWEEDRGLQFAMTLTRIFFGLSKEQREELGLQQDWNHHLET